MTPNVGTLDRLLRATLGVVLLSLAAFSGLPLFAEPLVAGGAGLVGLVMLATSAMKVCPLYTLLGFKTCQEC